MRNLFLGIDIGGTGIKGILTDEDGKLYSEADIRTGVKDGNQAVCNNIAFLIEKLMEGCDRRNILGVGMGCPGIIDRRHGVVVFSANLNMRNFPLAAEIERRVMMPVVMANDAHTAALGESVFGAGSDYRNSILVTLGTGIGGGVVIDDRLFEGGGSAGTEIGHMVIVEGGELCACGRRGCFERYCSASALTRITRRAMEEHPGSAMWNTYNLLTCSAKTVFDYMDTDPVAREITDDFFHKLATGLVNIANIFRPEVIMIGGGMAAQKERLTAPVQKLFDEQLYGGTDYMPVEIVTASLGNKAGSFGAAALMMGGD
ncbi:MAG: ROK family protein [Clostridia bacterium]|nr:ROK family protein [Clostridia bacterium]